MGSILSLASNPPPPSTVNAPPEPCGLAPAAQEQEAKSEKVDYMNLPCPIPYHHNHSEAAGEHLIFFDRISVLSFTFLLVAFLISSFVFLLEATLLLFRNTPFCLQLRIRKVEDI
jgi:hypothetical protein